MLNIKPLTTFTVLALQLMCVLAPIQAQAVGGESRKLMITAYYSPLPNQSFYIRGSYEADIRLNGRGTHGADGTAVYPGMLAAPKTYPFGTQVKIPGLGVGVVHDRGGAILSHENYDRIDVWMGAGEEGLSRALNWGSRTVEGEVYFSGGATESGFDYSWVNSQLPASYLAKLQSNSVSTPQEGNDLSASLLDATVTTPPAQPVAEEPQQILTTTVEPVKQPDSEEVKRLTQNLATLTPGLGKGDQGERVKNLQRTLWDLDYYHQDLSGVYDQATIEAVYKLQAEAGIVSAETDEGAGYFGKKTLDSLNSALERKIKRVKEYPQEAQVWVPAKAPLPQVASLILPEVSHEKQKLNFSALNKKVVQEKIQPSLALKPGYRSQEVKALQELLILHHYLAAGLNTGYFGPKTSEAVLKFQVEKGIVTSAMAGGAGEVNEKTWEALHLL